LLQDPLKNRARMSERKMGDERGMREEIGSITIAEEMVMK
jgi:hypothetical protein